MSWLKQSLAQVSDPRRSQGKPYQGTALQRWSYAIGAVAHSLWSRPDLNSELEEGFAPCGDGSFVPRFALHQGSVQM